MDAIEKKFRARGYILGLKGSLPLLMACGVLIPDKGPTIAVIMQHLNEVIEALKEVAK